ncbi:hypothetical protein [Mycoplasma sp. Ms02]|uniref:hypothetical protein n=1 Tax=Mycoplasma sp. Ms02 TaxID=353851 RepID=UPI001C8A8942|nr:hypothetical protein [Mycoplasma sp. Ms02]QZE12495.1 hypothetical protein K4L35_00685 [Mycoplasma sp. Ms02]
MFDFQSIIYGLACLIAIMLLSFGYLHLHVYRLKRHLQNAKVDHSHKSLAHLVLEQTKLTNKLQIKVSSQTAKCQIDTKNATFKVSTQNALANDVLAYTDMLCCAYLFKFNYTLPKKPMILTICVLNIASLAFCFSPLWLVAPSIWLLSLILCLFMELTNFKNRLKALSIIKEQIANTVSEQKIKKAQAEAKRESQKYLNLWILSFCLPLIFIYRKFQNWGKD